MDGYLVSVLFYKLHRVRSGSCPCRNEQVQLPGQCFFGDYIAFVLDANLDLWIVPGDAWNARVWKRLHPAVTSL